MDEKEDVKIEKLIIRALDFPTILYYLYLHCKLKLLNIYSKRFDNVCLALAPYTIHIHKMQIGYLKTTIIVMVTAMINANV